ncbi:MAG: DNA translocase FtsK 4TM domain-containing protein [Polyangiales bacterium]
MVVYEAPVPSQVNARRGSPVALPEPKRHEVAGLVTLAAAILVGLAVASWDARGGRDWSGPLGARVAEAMIALLGAAAALVPLSLLLLAVRLFRRTARPLQPARAIGTACIVVAVSAALHLWWGEGPALGGLPAGGLVGTAVGELLRGTVGTAGANTVVLTALLVALVVRTRLSIVSLASTARAAGGQGTGYLRDGAKLVARAWKESRRDDRPRRSLTAPAPEALAEAALRPVLDATDDDDDEGDDSLAVRLASGDDDPLAPAAPEPAPAPAPRRGRSRAKPAVIDAVAVDEAPAPVVVTHASPPPEVPTVTAAAEPEPTPARPAPRARAQRPKPAPTPAVSDDDGPAPWYDEPLPAALVLPAATDSVDEAPEPEPEPAPRVKTARARPSSPPPAAPPTTRAREVVVDEVADEEEDDAPLTIVTHEREIERAMKSAAVPVERVAAKVVPEKPMEFPPVELLAAPPPSRVAFDEGALRGTADRLIKTLADYTIDGRVMEIHPGPVVTTYEVLPAAGTKLAKIVRLGDDIAMSLEASKVRIVAPIPGKGRVGFEIPNAQRQTVYFRELVETEAFQKLGGALPVALGKDVVGTPYFADLATMPHLIVAGATGAGKSVGLNVMLASLLYKRGPEDVRLLMIDPKMVELQVYDGIPHMLLPVVTDMKKATLALRWVVDEMERRYALFAQTGARNITTYNDRVQRALAEGKTLRGLDGPVRTKNTGTTRSVEEGEAVDAPTPVKLPYILCVVDEFADLIMVAGKEIEAAVARLAQKARAAGIHVILATQRPSVDVITGMIKANFPARIAFKVSQRVDSRTILDQQGAEHLLGRGDMLILPPGSSDLRRVHCAFVNEDEVQRVTDHWRTQGEPTYDDDILKPREDEEPADDGPAEIKVPQDKYERAVALVLGSRKCSTSYVQRYLGIGYNVAARIVDKMEREGIVGAPKGPGKEREVLG